MNVPKTYECKACGRKDITEEEHKILVKIRKKNIECDCSIAKTIVDARERIKELKKARRGTQTVKITCQICGYDYIHDFPKSITEKEMDTQEKNYVCTPCIKHFHDKMEKLKKRSR